MTKPLKVTLYSLVSLLFIVTGVEFGLQVNYRIKYGVWYSDKVLPWPIPLFESHPYLAGQGKPLARFITKEGKNFFTHNSLGMRNREVSFSKKAGVRRILAFGGSTTYCPNVPDDQTWPNYLGEALGPQFEVINMGIPGYSTVEHLIQTALNVSDLSPDICVYYIGWNDIRNMHIKGLKSDYSDFHGPAQYANLCIFQLKKMRRSLLAFYLVETINNYFLEVNHVGKPIEGAVDKFTAKIDPRALGLFERNIHLIIALCRAQGITPIMVPQLLNYAKLVDDKPYGWLPFVKDKDMRVVMAGYNEALRKICAQEQVDYIGEVLQAGFTDEYFVDNGHFSASGNKKFAGIIKDHILHPAYASE